MGTGASGAKTANPSSRTHHTQIQNEHVQYGDTARNFEDSLRERVTARRVAHEYRDPSSRTHHAHSCLTSLADGAIDDHNLLQSSPSSVVIHDQSYQHSLGCNSEFIENCN